MTSHTRALRYPQAARQAEPVLLNPRMSDAGMGKARRCVPEEPTLVYARWAGAGGRTQTTSALESKKHIYSSSIPPEKPLRLGMRVRILATSPAWYTNADEDTDTYDTYDAHLVGTITGVAGWKGRKIVLEVRNECALNPVGTARIRLPFVPEVTVQLDADLVPPGQKEAQETDLNTHAAVRCRSGDVRCEGHACRLPWRSLVGESFLWEPMVEEVGERPGIKPGRKKVPLSHFAGWGETAEAETFGF